LRLGAVIRLKYLHLDALILLLANASVGASSNDHHGLSGVSRLLLDFLGVSPAVLQDASSDGVCSMVASLTGSSGTPSPRSGLSAHHSVRSISPVSLDTDADDQSVKRQKLHAATVLMVMDELRTIEVTSDLRNLSTISSCEVHQSADTVGFHASAAYDSCSSGHIIAGSDHGSVSLFANCSTTVAPAPSSSSGMLLNSGCCAGVAALDTQRAPCQESQMDTTAMTCDSYGMSGQLNLARP